MLTPIRKSAKDRISRILNNFKYTGTHILKYVFFIYMIFVLRKYRFLYEESRDDSRNVLENRPREFARRQPRGCQRNCRHNLSV